MKINNDHMYHGAALTQIAEHPKFTAINVFQFKGAPSRSAFLINDDIGIYIKYATKPSGNYQEYIFTFRDEHIEELGQLEQKTKKVFVVLICVQDRHTCCLSLRGLRRLITRRWFYSGRSEDQYVILVTLPLGRWFRVYISPPGVKRRAIGLQKVPRDRFPAIIFK